MLTKGRAAAESVSLGSGLPQFRVVQLQAYQGLLRRFHEMTQPPGANLEDFFFSFFLKRSGQKETWKEV